MKLTEERIKRFESVISNRQYDLTIILENVHDPHNIGAVLRTCDSIGIREIFVIYTDPRLMERGIEIGHKSSSGANHWIDINYFEDVHECMKHVKLNYHRIIGTSLTDESASLYEVDFSTSCAILFGNEHSGISEEALPYIDIPMLIPQHGFVKSLNISVACAVTLYECQRQRLKQGRYSRPFGEDARDEAMFRDYENKHWVKKFNRDD